MSIGSAGAKVVRNIVTNKFCTMKVVELLKIGGEMLRLLSENEVSRDDWRYVGMYEEFHNMRDSGMKYREAVRMLSEDYRIGRATVERIIRRLDMEC